jgi:hypothetical protein
VDLVVEDYLAGVDYPATKHELIDAALDAGAPQEVVERLQRLSREQYDNPGELERELAEPGEE